MPIARIIYYSQNYLCSYNPWLALRVRNPFRACLLSLFEKAYSRVRNKHSPTLINFLTFFQGLLPYSRLHRANFSSISIRYNWGYAYSFCQNFQGLCLFQTLEYAKMLNKSQKCSSIGGYLHPASCLLMAYLARLKHRGCFLCHPSLNTTHWG